MKKKYFWYLNFLLIIWSACVEDYELPDKTMSNKDVTPNDTPIMAAYTQDGEEVISGVIEGEEIHFTFLTQMDLGEVEVYFQLDKNCTMESTTLMLDLTDDCYVQVNNGVENKSYRVTATLKKMLTGVKGTVGKETVEGEFIGKSVMLTFNHAESLESVKLQLSMVDADLIYPEQNTLNEGVDLSKTLVITLKDRQTNRETGYQVGAR